MNDEHQNYHDAEVERRARAEWERNSAIREEFNGDVESYVAFMVADSKGLVRVLRGPDPRTSSATQPRRGRDLPRRLPESPRELEDW